MCIYWLFPEKCTNINHWQGILLTYSCYLLTTIYSSHLLYPILTHCWHRSQMYTTRESNMKHVWSETIFVSGYRSSSNILQLFQNVRITSLRRTRSPRPPLSDRRFPVWRAVWVQWNAFIHVANKCQSELLIHRFTAQWLNRLLRLFSP